MAEQRTATKELKRCDYEQQAAGQGVKVEENGDVLFWAVLVDKNKVPNRRGFVFDWKSPDDVNVTNLMLNPVLLYRHENRELPIGRIEKIDVNSKRVKIQGRIRSYKGIDGLEGREAFLAPIRQSVMDGDLRAVSMGFYIDDGVIENADKDDEFFRVTKFEIVEGTICTLGAHVTALIQQSADEIAEAFAEEGVGARSWEETGRTDKRVLYRLCVEEAEDDGDPAGRWPSTPNPAAADDDGTSVLSVLGEPLETQAESWRAIPYSRHGDKSKAGEDTPWEGPRYVKEASVDQLKVMCALEDSENIDSKRGYKLPHHKPDATVVWKGAAAAMGAILGARGGVKGVPVEARRGAHGHLKKHYKQFDKDAPEFKQDYSTEEINAMHDAGLILVVGREPSHEFVLGIMRGMIGGLDKRVSDALDELSGRVDGKLEDRQGSELTVSEGPEKEHEQRSPVAERQADGSGSEVGAVDEDGLRKMVRQLLEGDEEFGRCRKEVAGLFVETIRRQNSERAGSYARTGRQP